MPFTHASVIVTGGETREHGRWIREFWLQPRERDWVEVDAEEHRDAPRTHPYRERRLLVMRGPLGELLGQEFVDGFEDPEALLELQRACDALRAAEDETKWTTERREAIGRAQDALDAAVYGSAFRFGIVVLAFTDEAMEWLKPDLDEMTLADATFLDFTGRAGHAAIPHPATGDEDAIRHH